MKLKAAGGHTVDIVGEIEHDGVEYYAVWHNIDNEEGRDPFLIRKDNRHYELIDLTKETPQAGDIVAGPYASSTQMQYRVLGATETQILIVNKEDYASGDWPVVSPGELQTEALLGGTQVYIRELPDKYLRVVERP